MIAQFARGVERKVFTTPVPNKANELELPNIVTKNRRVNKERGCAAVSIGVKDYRSERRSLPDEPPTESGLA